MTQRELVKDVASKVNASESKNSVTEAAVNEVLNTTVSVITETVAKGDKIQIAGLGTFEVAERAAREGRNPATGETMNIPAKKVPKFKAAKAFKDIVM